ncbi:MAG: AAA family ATPase [Bacteroidota bacterium]
MTKTLGQRIMIIGCSGAGKSTLSRKLGERTGLPVLHLDQHYWHAGWIESDKSSWEKVTDELIAGEQWIIDGNYGGTMDKRIERADTIIFLDYSTLTCLTSATKRILTHYGKTRPDMTEGCPERFDAQFYHYMFMYRWKRRPGILRKLAAVQIHKRVHIFPNRRATQRFLSNMHP